MQPYVLENLSWTTSEILNGRCAILARNGMMGGSNKKKKPKIVPGEFCFHLVIRCKRKMFNSLGPRALKEKYTYLKAFITPSEASISTSGQAD